ncbi:MAG: hypothetical protein KF817_00415 [Phycisphaeraceae bacterium]|nr:hypothetical protein [Phycisphaeraceae bacterium]
MPSVRHRGSDAQRVDDGHRGTRGVVYIYHFLDDDHAVRIDRAEAPAQGARVLELPSLFPEKPAFTQFRADRLAEIDAQRRARLAADVDRSGFAAFAGTYGVNVGARTVDVDVTHISGRLFIHVRGKGDGSRIELLPESADRFFHVDFEGTTGVRFLRDASGAVTGLEYTSVLGHRYTGVRATPAAGDP